MTSGNGSGDGYGVHTGELASHAGGLRAVADALGQAQAAAKQVTLSPGAYGHMPDSAALIAIVEAVSLPGLLALGHAQQAVSGLADGVQETASTYDQIDGANSAKLRELEQ